VTLFQFFNQHSYLLISAIVLGSVALALVMRRVRLAWLIWLGLLALVLIGWLGLRTGEGASLTSVEDYEASLRAGRPTLVEFYSDY
jgi:hypothetical protein